MTQNLRENIRDKRKQMRLTQEQLAEAVGVTVGAVSKWELGQSAPDLSTLIHLADFFQCSIDSLIGYEVQNNDKEHMLKRIKRACDEKRFKEGIEEAEKALQKFPNAFDIVYQSVILFHASGLEKQNAEHMRKALELGERALLLIEQNEDENVTEVSIRHGIAMAHLNLGDEAKAVELMKRNNPAGAYNYQLGYVLARMEGRIDEAVNYMSDAWITNFHILVSLAIGYFNAFEGRERQSDVLKFTTWALQLFPGATKEGEASVLTKWEAFLWAICAITELELKKKDLAIAHFRKAKELAAVYDKSPKYDMTNVELYFGKNTRTIVDGIGSCVSDAIYQACKEQKDPECLKLWEKIYGEKDVE